MSPSPYEPPSFTRDARPAVIGWYRGYAGFLALCALGATVLSALSHGQLTVASSALLAVLFGVGAFVPFKPWGWMLGLVVIGLGLAGPTIIVAVPLLVMWLQPTVKAAFACL